jgi:hypothetical protein
MKEKTTERVAELNKVFEKGSIITTVNVAEVLTKTPYEKLDKKHIDRIRTWFVSSCVQKNGYATLYSTKQVGGVRGINPYKYIWNGEKTDSPAETTPKKVEESKVDSSERITTSDIGESLLKYIQDLKDYKKLLEEEIETLKNEKGELQRSWDMQQLEIMKLTAHVQDLNKKISSSRGREVSVKEIMNRA